MIAISPRSLTTIPLAPTVYLPDADANAGDVGDPRHGLRRVPYAYEVRDDQPVHYKPGRRLAYFAPTSAGPGAGHHARQPSAGPVPSGAVLFLIAPPPPLRSRPALVEWFEDEDGSTVRLRFELHPALPLA